MIELCVFCSPQELTEVYGKELPICNTCYEDEGYESRKQQQDYFVKCEVCNKAYNEEQIRNSDIFPDYENICRVCIE